MIARTYAATALGFDGEKIEVECDASNGLPTLLIVGLGNKAIDEATKAIGMDPGLVNPYINRAWAYCEIGLYEKAIADCQTALTIEPQNALAFNNLGLAYHRMTQLATARQYYQKACDLKLAVACRNYRLLLSE